MLAPRSLPAIAMAALVMGLSLQACAQNAKPGHAASAGMTAAPVKPGGSGIGVQYRIDGTPQPGSPVPVVLNFDGVSDPAGGTVKLAADGGLAIAGSAGPHTLPAGQASALTVQVVPDAGGTGYLHVFTTQNGATSATSIAVQVGKAPSAMPASSGLKQAPDGDKIISMPVK
ncbi:hypothetical protein H6CHR_00388 [Variovorax sp. PBL-H6]|uniref:hypothetical protein n=1 Tax=Variovorax sp. PBL-H6 TaxID=434009 RepID=UPI0013175098|nr:hypothetical protein [Variovorax sp. PBL-H6]VTU15912.1 hypothetical protein H6CHR_00388 [Variovorax sp. PBL-H6]